MRWALILVALAASPSVRAQAVVPCSPALKPATDARAELADLNSGRATGWALHAWNYRSGLELRIAIAERNMPELRRLIVPLNRKDPNRIVALLAVAYQADDISAAQEAFSSANQLLRTVDSLDRRGAVRSLANASVAWAGAQKAPDALSTLRAAEHELAAWTKRRNSEADDIRRWRVSVAVERAAIEREAAPAELRDIIVTELGTLPAKAEWASLSPVAKAQSLASLRDALARTRPGTADAAAALDDAMGDIESQLTTVEFEPPPGAEAKSRFGEALAGAWTPLPKYVDERCVASMTLDSWLAGLALHRLEFQQATERDLLAIADASIARAEVRGRDLPVYERRPTALLKARLRAEQADRSPTDKALGAAAADALAAARAVSQNCLCARENEVLDRIAARSRGADR